MSIVRSAVYLNRVSKAYSAITALKIEARRAAQLAEFEAVHTTEIDEVFERLHKVAKTGAFYMRLTPGDFLYRADMKAYMQMKGFEYRLVPNLSTVPVVDGYTNSYRH